jgi:hypothetical protein
VKRRRFRFAPLIDHLIGGANIVRPIRPPFGVYANAATARSISPVSPRRAPERARVRMHASLYRKRYSDFTVKRFQ